MRLFPKLLGDLERVDLEVLPPCNLISDLVQLPMMAAAEWYGEFVADFEAEGSRLGKSQMMRIGRLSTAHEAWLRGNKSQMGFVTQPFGLGDGENALVDLPWHEAGCDRNNRGAGGRPNFQLASALSVIPGDYVLTAAVIAGRPWDGGRIVRVETETHIRGHRNSRR